MKPRSVVLPFVFLILLASGCSGPEVKDEGEDSEAAAVEDLSTSQGADAAGARTQGIQDATAIQPDALEDPNSMLSQRIIYFAFDSDEIGAENFDLIAAHGAYLADNPDISMRLEGHADERGSREYNIGLGERRAMGVRRLLLLQGGRAEQMPVISYGEERPEAFGHDDAAWARNRRVELVYPR